ncbi:MAG: Nif11-like leader peptide family RiPP precursor [Oscillospiraceae bacterium]|nr:Nif11-like leader peptide family RiPP precursor [Oscillospiraceae bacterium]
MANDNMQNFLRFLAEDKGHQAKAKSLAGDMDAMAAYAAESGFDITANELREYREKSLRLLEAKVKKADEQKAALSPGVSAFYDLLALAETDSAVERRLEELTECTREDLIAYGKEKGFIFGEQDLDAVGKDALELTDELSEEELELVAGGITVFVGVFLMLAAGIAIVGGIATFMVSVSIGNWEEKEAKRKG